MDPFHVALGYTKTSKISQELNYLLFVSLNLITHSQLEASALLERSLAEESSA